MNTEYYEIVFPNPGDGTAFSPSDLMEVEEFWHQIAEMKRAGVLRQVDEKNIALDICKVHRDWVVVAEMPAHKSNGHYNICFVPAAVGEETP